MCLCVCQTIWFGMLGMKGRKKWVGCGIEDSELHDIDNVKEVSRWGEPPM